MGGTVKCTHYVLEHQQNSVFKSVLRRYLNNLLIQTSTYDQAKNQKYQFQIDNTFRVSSIYANVLNPEYVFDLSLLDDLHMNTS
jgi:hypothetical protein